MAIPADLKFDVRVRERLLAAGLISETEVNQHLEALPDLQGQAVDLTVKQPALQAESDRDIVIVRASGARPPIAPVRPVEDDLDMPIPDDDEDDDEDDDDDDEETKVFEKDKLAAVEKTEKVEKAEKKEVDSEASNSDAEREKEKTDGEWGDEP